MLFVNTSFSQESAKNRVFVLSDWSGGIATRLSDETNNPKYARIAENIRLGTSVKDITKRNQVYTYGTALTSTEAITSIYRLYLKNLSKVLLITQGNSLESAVDTTGVFTEILPLTTGDYRFQWVTWHDLMIGGDGQNQPIKTDGTHATYLGACYAADNGAGAGPNGAYKYKVTFYTATYEVLFEVTSNLVTVTDNDIDLSMIPIGPDTYLGEDIVGRKVYRSDAGGAGDYDLLSNGTIADNSTTTLTDSDDDATCEALTDYPAGTATWTPPKGKFYCVNQDRLFIANNATTPSRVWYSKQTSHDLFETATDYRDIRNNDGDEVTSIFNLLGMMWVAKTNTIQKFDATGDDPDADWSISDPYSHIGCDAPYSGANTPLGWIYLSKSNQGLYIFNGQNSLLKSELFTPTIIDILSSNLGNVVGKYSDNIYYMAYASSTVGGSANNRMLCYDLLLNAATVDTISINALCTLSGGSDGGVLFVGASDSGKVYKFKNTSLDIIHSKHADFTGTWNDTRYIPVEVDGDPNNPIIELAWDCTTDGWSAEILGKDGTWDGTIDDINVHLTDAICDRPDGGGTYISPVISTVSASTYDKIYWNETLPSGCDATFAIRSGATSAACVAAGWSAEYTLANGSDISGVTANEYTQYRITLSSTPITTTPTITTNGGYTVKLVYNTIGTPAESAVALHWQTPWLIISDSMYTKSLRKIFVKHSGTVGNLTIKVTNEFNESDTFSIDMSVYPTEYEAYFTNGVLQGKKFQLDITNSDLNAVKVKEIDVLYDISPIV